MQSREFAFGHSIKSARQKSRGYRGSGNTVRRIFYDPEVARVNGDGLCNLRGYAYGANIGWINFESTGAPAVSLLTGALSGYAYGSKVGWIANRTSELVEYNTYSAEKGQDEADALAMNKGPRMRLTNILAERLRRWIVDEKVSPYVAILRMRKEGHTWVPCVRTVYYAIERGDLEIIRANLPYGTINMKPRRKGRRMAYRTLRGKSITERPPEAEHRVEYGHWEMDTVVGRTGGSGVCLLVMTERTTREEIIRRLPYRSQRSVIRSLRGLERRPDNLFASMRSLTCDNGSEFWDFAAIERSTLNPKNTRCALYYTHPFSAFERGSNENNNRIIRRFIPKGSDIADFSLKAISDIEQKINTMERHSLGGLSASQAKKSKLYEPAA